MTNFENRLTQDKLKLVDFLFKRYAITTSIPITASLCIIDIYLRYLGRIGIFSPVEYSRVEIATLSDGKKCYNGIIEILKDFDIFFTSVGLIDPTCDIDLQNEVDNPKIWTKKGRIGA